MARSAPPATIVDVQRYWDARPCNVRHSTQPVGSKEYFDEVEARKYLIEPHIPGFARFERWRGKRVLEVGCGIGTDTVNFARAGAEVTAVDLSSESLRLAEQRAEVMGVADRIRFVQANAEELTSAIDDGAYDLVYSFGVVHHTPHPERALAQIHALTAPGERSSSWSTTGARGRSSGPSQCRGGDAFGKLEELVAKHSEAQTGCPVTFTYTRRKGRELVERAGFEVHEAKVDHVFPYRIRDYVEYRYVKEPYFRWMPDSLFRALERRLGWHLLITAERPLEA